MKHFLLYRVCLIQAFILIYIIFIPLGCDDSTSANTDEAENDTTLDDQFVLHHQMNQDQEVVLNQNNPQDMFVTDQWQDTNIDMSPDIVCEQGTRQCLSAEAAQVCELGNWVRVNCSNGERCQNGNCLSENFMCTPGDVRGCYSSTELEVCDDTGTQLSIRPCPEGESCSLGTCSNQICRPNSRQCDPERPNIVQVCNQEGSAWVMGDVCAEGAQCQGGRCATECELAAKLKTYIGCEYWTVDLDNYPDPFTIPMPNEVPHSVVLSNPGAMEAQIRFETRSGATITVDNPIIPAGGVRAFTMPRLDVDGSGISFNSIRILSSMPVNAYQFNPLNNDNVFSNDASLLLPVSSLGRRHIVASWSTGIDTSALFPLEIVPQAGYFTVLAVSPGITEVTVTVSANTVAGSNVPALIAGEQYTFELEQFQVLNLEAASFAPVELEELFSGFVYDLTGSIVEASQPIAVFGGHEEAVVAYTEAGAQSYCCADHLEEQMFPLDVWTNEVLCAKIKPRSASGEKDVWRIFSAVDGNQISTIPPIPNLNGIQLNFGEWVQVDSESSFKLTGTGPVMAVQYMISQEQTDEVKGDPSMILSVPTGQYRKDYSILVPEGYNEDWVTVIRPVGLEITFDGNIMTETFTPFADGQWEMAYIGVSAGIHRFTADQTFGLIAYGWNQAVSYGYPAGLNLRSADWMP